MPLPPSLTPRLARLLENLPARTPTTGGDDPALLWAAVAVVLAPSPESVLLIRRAQRRDDPWSGHMALPGGRRDPGDPDLVATALREAAEEVGLTLVREQLVGTLDDVVPRTSVLPPIAVRPHVFLLPSQPALVLNPEVAAATWVTFDQLLRAGTYRSVALDIAGEIREFPAYHLDQTPVWGLTERVLTNLLASLTS